MLQTHRDEPQWDTNKNPLLRTTLLYLFNFFLFCFDCVGGGNGHFRNSLKWNGYHVLRINVLSFPRVSIHERRPDAQIQMRFRAL